MAFEGRHLAHSLRGLFDNDKVTAFASFVMATEGLTASQAANVPAERFNSVWAIVNHVWFWNEAPLRLIRGEKVEPADLGASDWSAWVPIADPSDEAEWETARKRAIESNAAFAAYVETLDNEALGVELANWGIIGSMIVEMIAHNSYHTNEIISVRHMQGLWLANT